MSESEDEDNEDNGVGGTQLVLPSDLDADDIERWLRFHDMSAGKAFQLVYKFKPGVNIINDEEGEGGFAHGNARDWWERASAVTQCNNVIGPCVYGPKKPTTICYICGFPIMASDGTAECEHVLPVFKAALYLGLYNTNDHRDIMASGGIGLGAREKEIYNELKMEYRWAHRCCNQKKKEHDFIEAVAAGGGGVAAGGGTRFQLDETNARQILNEIYRGLTSSKDGHCREASLKKQFKNLNKDLWINERLRAFNRDPENPVKQIIDYLNQKWTSVAAKSSEGMNYLTSLCSLISAADMIKVWSAWNVLSGVERPPRPPKVIPIIILTEAEIIARVAKEAEDASKITWGNARDLRIGGNTKKIYDFYKYVFECDGIKIPLIINFSGDPATKHEILPAVLDSLIKQKQQDGPVGNFFPDFCAILTQATQDGVQPLFPLTIPANDDATKRANQEIQSHVADIVGSSLEVVLFARMAQKCAVAEGEFGGNLIAQYLGFQDKLGSKLTMAIDNLFTEMNKYFADDNNVKCKFLRMLLNLCETIDPSILEIIEQKIAAFPFDFAGLCNDAAIVAECAAFTDPTNIAHAVVSDYILNSVSDEEWNDVDIKNDQNRILQNIAHAARTIIKLQITPLSDEEISFLNDEFEREQLLADLETYMLARNITLNSLPSGRWLGQGIQVESLDKLTNDELKYSLKQLYKREQQLQEEEKEEEEYNIDEQKKTEFYKQAQQEIMGQVTTTAAGGGGRAQSITQQQQIKTRADQLYDAWVAEQDDMEDDMEDDIEDDMEDDIEDMKVNINKLRKNHDVMREQIGIDADISSSSGKRQRTSGTEESNQLAPQFRQQFGQGQNINTLSIFGQGGVNQNPINLGLQPPPARRNQFSGNNNSANGGKSGGGPMGGGSRKRNKKSRRRNTRRKIKHYNKKSKKRGKRKTKTRKR